MVGSLFLGRAAGESTQAKGGPLKACSESHQIKRRNRIKTLAAFAVLVCKSMKFLPGVFTISGEEKRG